MLQMDVDGGAGARGYLICAICKGFVRNRLINKVIEAKSASARAPALAPSAGRRGEGRDVTLAIR